MTDNFKCYFESGSNTVYVIALRAGELQVGIRANENDEFGYLKLNVVDADAADTNTLFLGNLNKDDAVNAKDAADILIEAARIGTNAQHSLTEQGRAAADVNFDGKVNAKDANVVLIYAALRGTDPTTPAFATFMMNKLIEAAKPAPTEPTTAAPATTVKK